VLVALKKRKKKKKEKKPLFIATQHSFDVTFGRKITYLIRNT